MKQNIIWIASYPKSGNTMVRAFLSAYFFTKNGILSDFSPLKNIKSFNSYNNFKYLNNFPELSYFKKKPEEISKYWQNNQETLNIKLNSKVIFFKTHNALIKHNSNYFTNNKLTKCFIYIVRDPRSVVISTKNHYGFKNYDEATDFLLSDKWLSYATTDTKMLPEFILSWKTNFLSWQNFSAINNGIIIRYEDLLKKPEKTFLLLIEFLANQLSLKIDKKKFSNSVKSIHFNNLQKIEINKGFIEKSKKSNLFFRKGKVNEWQEVLEKKLIEKILLNFEKEMAYLDYY